MKLCFIELEDWIIIKLEELIICSINIFLLQLMDLWAWNQLILSFLDKINS